MEFMRDIENIMSGKACVVGMGNYYRCDDAVGLYVVDTMTGNVSSERISIINVEDVLESYLFKIAELNCDKVLIIDAVQTESPSGSVIFGKIDDLDDVIQNTSTHKLSLKLCGNILEQYNKETYLLGIEADTTDFGVGISQEVRKSADMIVDLLVRAINCSPKGVYQ